MKLEGDRREGEFMRRKLAADDVKTAASIVNAGGNEQ